MHLPPPGGSQNLKRSTSKLSRPEMKKINIPRVFLGTKALPGSRNLHVKSLCVGRNLMSWKDIGLWSPFVAQARTSFATAILFSYELFLARTSCWRAICFLLMTMNREERGKFFKRVMGEDFSSQFSSTNGQNRDEVEASCLREHEFLSEKQGVAMSDGSRFGSFWALLC